MWHLHLAIEPVKSHSLDYFDVHHQGTSHLDQEIRVLLPLYPMIQKFLLVRDGFLLYTEFVDTPNIHRLVESNLGL